MAVIWVGMTTMVTEDTSAVELDFGSSCGGRHGGSGDGCNGFGMREAGLEVVEA